MRMKLIVALVSGNKTEAVVEAGRSGGATGATIITSVRGEGLLPERTFFGLRVEAQRDLVMFLVADIRARYILERIRDAAGFDTQGGSGIAFQIDVEDSVGLVTQMAAIREEVEQEI
ncbi:MAG: P-II family nitrogen regulator [Chloroflexota bacterium]|nr:P-II family nitrogen regulator [Chloroflexota bacterium]